MERNPLYIKTSTSRCTTGILGLDLREVRQMKERTNGLGAKGVEGFATRIESQPGFGGYTSKGSRGSTYQHLYGFGEGLLGFSGGQGNQIFNPLQINLQAGQGDNSQSQEQGINQPGSSPYGGGLHGQINRRFDQMESSHVIESSSTLIATNKMIVLYFTVISVVYRFLRMQS